jgi:hypothetical protein
VFGVGVYELVEPQMAHMGWPDYHLPEIDRELINVFSRNAPVVVDELMTEFHIACCIYMFGMNAGVLVRDSACLTHDATVPAALGVVAYHHQHPHERPMLAPHLLKEWMDRITR